MPTVPKRTRDTILAAIQTSQPATKTELDYETPFQLLVAVILSAQTTDRQVNRTTPPLFALVRVPEDIATMPLSELESYVRSVNFYRNKARHIRMAAERLISEYHSSIPNDLTALQTLP